MLLSPSRRDIHPIPPQVTAPYAPYQGAVGSGISPQQVSQMAASSNLHSALALHADVACPTRGAFVRRNGAPGHGPGQRAASPRGCQSVKARFTA